MKTIMTTYPEFQALPRGTKIMLLVSENYFSDEEMCESLRMDCKPVAAGKPLLPARSSFSLLG